MICLFMCTALSERKETNTLILESDENRQARRRRQEGGLGFEAGGTLKLGKVQGELGGAHLEIRSTRRENPFNTRGGALEKSNKE